MHSTLFAVPRTLRALRHLVLAAITAGVAALDTVAFLESYRGLYEWASEHGISGVWAVAWPLQIDTFILIGELVLLVAVIERWDWRGKVLAWAVTIGGLLVSVGGNVGHVDGDATVHGTAAVPPVAAWLGLVLGLQLIKRIIGRRALEAADSQPEEADKPADTLSVEVPVRPADARLWPGSRRARKARARFADSLTANLSARVYLSADSLSALPHLSGQPIPGLSAATVERHDGETADRIDGAPHGAPADNPQPTAPTCPNGMAGLSTEQATPVARALAEIPDLDVDRLPAGVDCLAQGGFRSPGSGGHITHRHPEEDYRPGWADRLSGQGLTAALGHVAALSVGGSCCVLEKRVSGRADYTCPGPQAATDRPADNPTDRTDRLSVDESARLDRAEIADRIARIVGDQERAAGIAEIGCDLAESGQGISRNALRRAGATGGNRELTDVAALLRSAAGSDRGVTLTAAV